MGGMLVESSLGCLVAFRFLGYIYKYIFPCHLALTIWQASDWPVSLWGQGELAHSRAYL